MVLISAPSTVLTPFSAVEMMLVIFSPSPDSEAVNVSKFRSVSFTATSLSEITLSTLRSATRIFSWVLSVPSGIGGQLGNAVRALWRRRRRRPIRR